jgi:hypothetical protein
VAGGIRGVLRCFDHARRVLVEEDIVSFHCLGSPPQQSTAIDAFLLLTNFVDPVEPVAILAQSPRQLRPKLPSQRGIRRCDP